MEGEILNINSKNSKGVINCIVYSVPNRLIHIATKLKCHGGNSDDLVSIPAMTGTVAVNILFILMD